MFSPFASIVLLMVTIGSIAFLPFVVFLLFFLTLPLRFPVWIWRKAFPAWLARLHFPWTPTMHALELYAKGTIAEAAKDSGAAFDLFLQAAELGHPWAIAKLESETLKRDNPDRHSALKRLRRQRLVTLFDALRQRTPLGARAAERLYQEGLTRNHSHDFDKAQELFLEAARLGHAQAIAQVASNYCEGRWGNGQKPDYAQALPWVRWGAEQGLSADLLLTTGTFYEEGLDELAPDIEEAVYWYWQAAERGHPRAGALLQRYI